MGAPAAPSSGWAHTHAHAHTPHVSMHGLPTSASGERPGLHLPTAPPAQRRRNPSSGGYGGLWLSQDSPRARPSTPRAAESKGSLARSHSAPLLAPLPVDVTLWVRGKKAQVESPGQPTRREWRCLVSDLRAWSCLGMGEMIGRGYTGPSKEAGFGYPPPPRALTLQPGVLTSVPYTL